MADRVRDDGLRRSLVGAGVTAAVALQIAAVVVASMGATASLDQLIKQVPARRRIGVVAYSAYSRAADFHTGIFYYAPIILGWLVVIPAAAVTGWRDGASGQRSLALAAMVGGLIAHLLVTAAFAAPALLSQRRIRPDDEKALTAAFDRFERWHLVRTVIDVATLGAAVWALVVTL
jgi:hypothetical protein